MAEKLDKPGRFVSNIDGYPGHFSLPHPLQARHMRVWWKITVEDASDIERLDYDAYDAEWQAYVTLIRDFGEWAIENVPPGDLDGESVPASVQVWVMEKGNEYIYPFLMPRQRQLLARIL
jgi:hypothetical protein